MTDYIINYPLAGQEMDPANITLIVNGVFVDLLNSSRFNLQRLSITYDGKELTFSEIPETGVTSPSFRNEQYADLSILLNSTQHTCFSGKIRKVEANLQNRDAGFTYTAVGIQQLANDVTLRGRNGTPLYYRYAGTRVVTTTGTVTLYNSQLGETLVDMFEVNENALVVAGVPTSIGTPNADYPNIGLSRDFSIQNMNFLDAMLSLTSACPARKPFFDDIQTAWIFPDITESPEIVVDISSTNVIGLPYSIDTTNRWTRVQLQCTIDGNVMLAGKQTVGCVPYWESSLESTWCMQLASAEDPSSIPDDGGYTFVYRRWRILMENMGTNGVNPDAPYCAYALFDYGGVPRYVPLDAYIDLSQGLIVTKTPVVIHGNAWSPGRATGPSSVVFTWWGANSVPTSRFYYVTCPSTGYSGTAYTLFGVQRTKYEMIDAAQVTPFNAIAKLALLKDVIISGEVKIEGDIIPEFLSLNKKVIFRHPTKYTNIQSISAMLLGYTYEFGKRGVSTLSLTTDMSGLIRVN